MEVTYKGLTMNVANNFLIVDIDGWEGFPNVTNGSSPKPHRLGSWLGGMTSPGRVVTITADIVGDPDAEYTTLSPKRALRKAMALHQEESPLIVDLGEGDPPELLFARVTALEMPVNAGYIHKRRVVIEFEASDPRRYSVGANTARTGLPTKVRGELYPIKYGRYAQELTPANKGEAVLQNLGNTETVAQYKLTGPNSKPSITVRAEGHQRRTQFNVKLANNEVLAVDTATGKVTVDGADRNGITSGALVEDLGLPPGLCTVAMGGTGSTATNLTVTWRDANIS